MANTTKYSYLIGLKKGVKRLAIIGLPIALMQALGLLGPWADLTVGGVLGLAVNQVVNWLQNH